MNQTVIEISPEVESVFKKYPVNIRKKMTHLRNLIMEAASELELENLEETLKWGEPSYIAKHGSTLRMDWKPKAPDQYAIYFKCTSKLVPTFKLAFDDLFKYEGNRAIVFKLDDEIPKIELKSCIRAALKYHKVKNLPLLGIGV